MPDNYNSNKLAAQKPSQITVANLTPVRHSKKRSENGAQQVKNKSPSPTT